MAGDIEHKELLELTSNIAAAHVSNNQMSVDEIPALIQKIYRTLSTVQADNEGLNERPQPAVPIKKSVLPDHIICLEDGKKLKMLKRHLQTAYGMSPKITANAGACLPITLWLHQIMPKSVVVLPKKLVSARTRAKIHINLKPLI